MSKKVPPSSDHQVLDDKFSAPNKVPPLGAEGAPLVSIIIPTYNRAHLIGETLDSVLAQTYQNWECIIVDDGSSDNTDEVVGAYVAKDSRFKYYHRPEEHLPGGNGARNYGFKMSKGEYVNWFDSDDLMVSEKLEKKVQFMIANSLDMVISNTLNFYSDGTKNRPYDLYYDLSINPENYISQQIGWITNDALIKKSKIGIKFNEKVKSGQEYNFFSRLLFCDLKVDYIKQDLSMRRMHDNSIQTNLQTCDTEKKKELIFNELLLLNDVYLIAPKSIKKRGCNRIFRFSIETTKAFKLPKYKKQINEFMLKQNEFKFLVYFNIWLILNLSFGRGYFIFKKYSKML